MRFAWFAVVFFVFFLSKSFVPSSTPHTRTLKDDENDKGTSRTLAGIFTLRKTHHTRHSSTDQEPPPPKPVGEEKKKGHNRAVSLFSGKGSSALRTAGNEGGSRWTHKHPIRALLRVRHATDDFWVLEKGGLVTRYASKNGVDFLTAGSFHMAHYNDASMMVLCGQHHIWLTGQDIVEIRDVKGKMITKVSCNMTTVALHYPIPGLPPTGLWSGGHNGRLYLYMDEDSVKGKDAVRTLIMGTMVKVDVVTEVWNGFSGERELWVVQGSTVTIVHEARGKLADVSSILSEGVTCFRQVGSVLWCGTPVGSIRCVDIAARRLVRILEGERESRVCDLVASAGRVWASRGNGAVSVYGAHSGLLIEDEPLSQAHLVLAENHVPLALIEHAGGGSFHLISGGADKSVALWDQRQDPGTTPDTTPDESSETDSASSKGASGAAAAAASPPALDVGDGRVRAVTGPVPKLHIPVSSSARRKTTFGRQGSAGDVYEVESVNASSPPMDEDGSEGLGQKKKGGKKRVLTKLYVAVQSHELDKVEKEIAAMLAKRPTDITEEAFMAAALDRRGPKNRTALHVAALGEDVNLVKLLLDHKANIAAQDKTGLVAVQMASHPDIKALLLAAHTAAGIEVVAAPVPPAAPGSARRASLHTTGPPPSRARSHVRHKSGGVGSVGSIPSSGKTSPRSKSPRMPAGDAIALPQVSPAVKKALLRQRSSAAILNRKKDSGRTSTLSSPYVDRERRDDESSATLIQSFVRMRLARKELRILRQVREKCRNTVAEILKTEETYVRTLDLIINKLRPAMAAPAFRSVIPNEHDIQILFPSSLNMLYQAHHDWLAQLKERVANWTPVTCVGDLFLLLSPYLRMYSVYVSNFELSSNKIRDLRRRPGADFDAQVRELFLRCGSPPGDLPSLLITPVQRIPRYVLLLKDLLKSTSPQHPDYNNLLRAVKIMTDTTVLVDRKADDAKNAQKVMEVAESIQDTHVSLVQPNRRWVRDGPIYLVVDVGDVRWVHAVLFSDILLLSKVIAQQASRKTGDGGGGGGGKTPSVPKGVVEPKRYLKELPLLGASVHDILDKQEMDESHQWMFVVSSPKITFVFKASSAADKIGWMSAIEQSIALSSEGLQTRRPPPLLSPTSDEHRRKAGDSKQHRSGGSVMSEEDDITMSAEILSPTGSERKTNPSTSKSSESHEDTGGV